LHLYLLIYKLPKELTSSLDMSTLLETTPQPRTSPQAQSAMRNPTVDGWRGVAILLVLLEHAGQ